MKLAFLFAALLSAALLAGATAAQTCTFVVSLTGAQEVPPVLTAATGSASVTVNLTTGAVSVTGSYNNFATNATAAHIHGSAQRGRNAGVMLGLAISGGTSGTISGGGTLTPAQLASLRDGLTYVNVHTMANGGGELRGQIDSVPGSGSPGAAPIRLAGVLKPGNTIQLDCPPCGGTPFVLIGLPMAPCVNLPIPTPIACAPGPANLAIDPIVPPLAVTGSQASVTIPATLTSALIAAQCACLNGALGCVELSGALRFVIRP